MKLIIISLYVGLLWVCTVQKLASQEYKQKISREFAIAKPENSILYVYNINGSIKVEGYAGSSILIEVDESITAPDNKILETGKKEFKLAFDQYADTLIAYISSPYDSRPHRNWHYSDDREEIEYNYNLDFTIKVPYSMNLHISTVNDGVITVNNVRGSLHVNNVNAEITIKNAANTTWAHTVNGDVNVSYKGNPPEESSYYTINGNINVSYQPNLSADLQFKSMHGDFFTNFPQVELLPASVSKVKEKNGEGTVYKLSIKTTVRFGKGGMVFKFETLNGDVYIKKQS